MIEIPNISFEVTSRCNLNCLYCYNHWKCNKNNIPHNSTYKQTRKTLKKLLNVANVKHITFTGGEPLLAERFPELVLLARMKGISITVISNGTYPDFSKYKQLINLGVALFELPIHSHKHTIHDALTRHSGSWEKSTATLKSLIRLKADVVAVIVLTKLNCKDIKETLKYIYSLGIRRVMVNRINIGGEGIKFIKELVMSRSELTIAYKNLSSTAKTLKLSVSSNVCTPICLLNPKDYRYVYFTFCSFDFSKRPLTLDYKGNMRFCNHSPVHMGNIFTDNLHSILHSDKALQWKNITPDFCKDCRVYEKCKAGCRAASQQLGLSLQHPDPILNYTGMDENLLYELNPTSAKTPIKN